MWESKTTEVIAMLEYLKNSFQEENKQESPILCCMIHNVIYQSKSGKLERCRDMESGFKATLSCGEGDQLLQLRHSKQDEDCTSKQQAPVSTHNIEKIHKNRLWVQYFSSYSWSTYLNS